MTKTGECLCTIKPFGMFYMQSFKIFTVGCMIHCLENHLFQRLTECCNVTEWIPLNIYYLVSTNQPHKCTNAPNIWLCLSFPHLGVSLFCIWCPIYVQFLDFPLNFSLFDWLWSFLTQHKELETIAGPNHQGDVSRYHIGNFTSLVLVHICAGLWLGPVWSGRVVLYLNVCSSLNILDKKLANTNIIDAEQAILKSFIFSLQKSDVFCEVP